MLTSDTASVTDEDAAAELPVKGAASPDEEIQLSIPNVSRCCFPHYLAPFLRRLEFARLAATRDD